MTDKAGKYSLVSALMILTINALIYLHHGKNFILVSLILVPFLLMDYVVAYKHSMKVEK